MDVLSEAARLGRAGEPAALATVLRTAGSTPRHAAAKMVVGTEKILFGTIGGGRIEHEVTEAARRVALGGAALRIERNLVQDLAMCCGGKMDVYVEPLDAARWKPLGEAARRRGKRQPCALVTALDGSGKDVVDGDDVVRARRPRLEDGRFIEPVLPTDRLVLFGSGHVAHALAPLAARVGFELVVCDDDDRYATPERFPGARLVPSFDAAEVARDLAPFGPDDHVLILTRDHAVDQALLEQLLPRADLSYLGLIGSRGKLGRFRRRMENKGFTDETLWARLHAPVGLDIGAETPEEIAVAIVAELISVRHAR